MGHDHMVVGARLTNIRFHKYLALYQPFAGSVIITPMSLLWVVMGSNHLTLFVVCILHSYN